MAVNEEYLAGAFSVTYNTVDMGVQVDGVTLRLVSGFVPVTADAFGESRLDGIFTGLTSMQVTCELLQMTDLKRIEAFQYFNSAAHGTMVRDAGELLSAGAFAKILLLTRITGKVLSGFETYSFARAYPLGSLDYFLSAIRLRSWPITFEVFPTPPANAGDKLVWYTVT